VRALSEGSGRGSEFIIELPALEADEGQPNTLHQPEHAGPASCRRILIVDDNPDALETLKSALEALGHTVVGAHDAQSALAAVPAFQPDFALIDIQLPLVSGYELAEQLQRAWTGQGSTRLIALTGYGQPADRERSRAAGFSHHLVKPVELAQLTELLAEGT
jgi:CheY-like chemotaxis protein